jgi:hypothetical protein
MPQSAPAIMAGRCASTLMALFLPISLSPFLVIMNDPTYVGAKTKGRATTIALVGVLLYGLCRRRVAAVDGPDPWCVS